MDVLEHPDGVVAGRYRVVSTVGQGGMGRVRRAEDLLLRREVALKEILLPPGITGSERAHLLERIRREAQLAARLNHPGIVRVHDIIEHNGDPVIVMEYLDGRSLGTVIHQDGPVQPVFVAQIAAAVVSALRHAHAAGIVHRDLKPDNIVLTRDGRTVITDFGIARPLADGTPLTAPGSIIGTPAYMSPEQIEGRELTPAADLWSLGATLYIALEGTSPFGGESMTEVCVAILTRSAPVPRNAGPLTPLLNALLTKDPGQRANGLWVAGFLDDLQRRSAQPAGPTYTDPPHTFDPWGTTSTAGPPAAHGAYVHTAGSANAFAQGPARTISDRGPCLGILATGVAWAASMALPVWHQGSRGYSIWNMLEGRMHWPDVQWAWPPIGASLALTFLAALAVLLPSERFRRCVCVAALPVGMVGFATMAILSVRATDLRNASCEVGDGTAQDIASCIHSAGFGIGYYVAIAAVLLLIGNGMWSLVNHGKKR